MGEDVAVLREGLEGGVIGRQGLNNWSSGLSGLGFEPSCFVVFRPGLA